MCFVVSLRTGLRKWNIGDAFSQRCQTGFRLDIAGFEVSDNRPLEACAGRHFPFIGFKGHDAVPFDIREVCASISASSNRAQTKMWMGVNDANELCPGITRGAYYGCSNNH
jgi:hypothetical protein